MLASIGLDRRLDDYRIWQAWDEVVGTTIARNAQPIRLDGERLVVVVRNSSWMHELSYLKNDLLRQLNGWMGRTVISELHFYVGKLEPEPRPTPTPSTPAPAPDREASRSVDKDEADPIAAAFDRLWLAARRRRSNPQG